MLEIHGDPRIIKRWDTKRDPQFSQWAEKAIAAIRACPGVVVSDSSNP